MFGNDSAASESSLGRWDKIHLYVWVIRRCIRKFCQTIETKIPPLCLRGLAGIRQLGQAFEVKPHSHWDCFRSCIREQVSLLSKIAAYSSSIPPLSSIPPHLRVTSSRIRQLSQPFRNFPLANDSAAASALCQPIEKIFPCAWRAIPQ